MNNILILYNPYYNKTVIEDHLSLLKESGVTAFGKVRSKLNDQEHPNEKKLNSIGNNASKEAPIQLFLTDYNSMYVANVISVNKEIKFIKTPAYYQELDVEYWFVFDDLRLIAHKNFETIRDKILANFKAVNYNNHTYAIYGNPYIYPMQVTMKEEINYFEKEDANYKYYTDIFKSQEHIEMKRSLIDFNFGSSAFYSLAPNSQDNIISAELEYMQNRNNPLYDFSSVVVKYSKAVELELYRFMRELFKYLMAYDKSLESFPYAVQGRDYKLKDILEYKPNFGTYSYIIKSPEVKNALNTYIDNKSLKHFIFVEIPSFVRTMQTIRNESVHGDSTSLHECNTIRSEVIGIGQSGILTELQRHGNMI